MRQRSTSGRFLAAALGSAKHTEPAVLRALHSWRRAHFLGRVRFIAAWHHATIEIDVARDVRFGRDIDIVVRPDTRNVLRIGPGSSIGDRVLFHFKDSTFRFGDRVEIRRDTVFMGWGGTSSSRARTSSRGGTSSTARTRSASAGSHRRTNG